MAIELPICNPFPLKNEHPEPPNYCRIWFPVCKLSYMGCLLLGAGGGVHYEREVITSPTSKCRHSELQQFEAPGIYVQGFSMVFLWP